MLIFLVSSLLVFAADYCHTQREFFCSSVVNGRLYYFKVSTYAFVVSVIFLILFYVLLMAQSFRFNNMMAEIERQVSLDMSFLQQLQTYNTQQIQILQSRLQSKITLIDHITGKINNIGLLPLIMAWILAGYKLVIDINLGLNIWDFVLICFISSFIILTPIILLRHKLEQYVLFLQLMLKFQPTSLLGT
jgi:hypothetical protein